jgi:lincosamide nucleotidyltransferase A/C/D/E
MAAARVLDLLARFQERGIAVWLDGGWAVDALLGEQTRAHDDLDLVARLEDSARIERALNELGYVLAGGGAPLSFELVDDAGHQVDVHPASFTPTGDGMYRRADGEDWIYPAAGFGGVGRILGREVPCLTPEVVLVNHTTGYALDEAHERDVIALAERYGLPLPEFRRAG